MCMQEDTDNTCCKAVRVVPGKYEKMSWENLGGRGEEKRWDTGTSTVPWLAGVQKAVV